MDVSLLMGNAVEIGLQGLGRKPKTEDKRAVMICADEIKNRNDFMIY